MMGSPNIFVLYFDDFACYHQQKNYFSFSHEFLKEDPKIAMSVGQKRVVETVMEKNLSGQNLGFQGETDLAACNKQPKIRSASWSKKMNTN